MMQRLAAIVAIVIAVVVALALGFWAGSVFGGGGRGGAVAVMNKQTSTTQVSTAPRERKVLYWQDAMYNPPYISDKPGKSPMGMALTPVYADEVSAGSTVVVDPLIVQNMGVRTATVDKGALYATIRAAGIFMEPEQNHVEINLRVNGWIEKLYANQEGMRVAKGDPLFELYSPELTAAADEMIAATRAAGQMGAVDGSEAKTSAGAMVAASRRKLELLGLAGDQIDAIAKSAVAPQTVTFRSPVSGHIADKRVIEGSAVKAGEALMRIADRSTMWLQVQVYEQDLPLVHVGTDVTATTAALPGETLEGKVDFIYPHLDMTTRTATVRIVLANSGHRLHENMYATAVIHSQLASDTLTVPREAIIDSGIRKIVFVSEGNGHFEPRQVTTGLRGSPSPEQPAAEQVQILSGLTADEAVVTSGQFLLDSESNLREAIEKLRGGRTAAMGAETMP